MFVWANHPCCHLQEEEVEQSTAKLSRKELKKLKKDKKYADQLDALKSEDQFTLSQAEKSAKASNLLDNALDIKVSVDPG